MVSLSNHEALEHLIFGISVGPLFPGPLLLGIGFLRMGSGDFQPQPMSFQPGLHTFISVAHLPAVLDPLHYIPDSAELALLHLGHQGPLLQSF